MRIVVDRKKCAGMGVCEAEAGDLFQVGDYDGKLKVLDDTPGEERRAAIEAAIDFCPTGALSIVEDD